MEFPDASELAHAVEPASFPPMAHLRYEPPAPALSNVVPETTDAATALLDDVSAGSSVAIGVGSRGIRDIHPIVATTVRAVRDAGGEPFIVPAMGSHGGGTAAGQRDVLAELGVTADRVGCEIDARMDTSRVGCASIDGREIPVETATAATEADAILVINRIAPHTSFTGPIESGIIKMLVVGLGKRPGAGRIHRFARSYDVHSVLSRVLAVLVDRLPIVGGIGVIENAADRTAEIHPIPVDTMWDDEATLLGRARDLLPTLPFEELDLLVVDEMGKDVSGTGMDPNVIGRPGTGVDPPASAASVKRLYVRSLTPGTDGNANGIGLADAIHRDAANAVDPVVTYTNVLTSGYPGKAALPMTFPSDEQAMSALVDSLGAVPNDTLRIVHIQNTKELTELQASKPLVEDLTDPTVSIEGWADVTFDGGALRLDAHRSARED